MCQATQLPGQMPRQEQWPMLLKPLILPQQHRDVAKNLDHLDVAAQNMLVTCLWERLHRFLAKEHQRKVWRFLGFASSLVGFITFAFTPPFKKLLDLRFWGRFGMVIYCALGISVCCVMLCTPRWRVSRSKVLTAHVVFFVLMLTSVYSFVLDKTEGDTEKKEWEKVLNLVSCGAFSVMSLSLSRLTGLGFESGVFNYFLGSFMTAVMSWNWKFSFVTVIFCYILFIIHTNSDNDSDIEQQDADDTDDIPKYLDSALYKHLDVLI